MGRQKISGSEAEKRREHLAQIAARRAEKAKRTRLKNAERRLYKYTYVAWVFPINGEPIRIGPLSSEERTMERRYQIVERLIKEDNARPLDIRLLAEYKERDSSDCSDA